MCMMSISQGTVMAIKSNEAEASRKQSHGRMKNKRSLKSVDLQEYPIKKTSKDQ